MDNKFWSITNYTISYNGIRGVFGDVIKNCLTPVEDVFLIITLNAGIKVDNRLPSRKNLGCVNAAVLLPRERTK